jgi:two-component system chemotaxis response regulator CheB
MTADRHDIDVCLDRLLRAPPRAVAIGGSAGSVEVLLELLPALGPTLPLPVVVVIHLPAGQPSLMPVLLAQRGCTWVKEAEPWEPLQPRTVYFAPPGYHLSIEPDQSFSLSAEDPVQYSRPSIDVLFASAAPVYRRQLLAVLLSGANADGADGLARVKAFGGSVVVQDPQTAMMPAMPAAALKRVEADCVLDVSGIRALFGRLAANLAGPPGG